MDFAMEEEGVELHPTSSNAGRSVDGAQREETHYTGDPLIPYTGQRRFTTLGAERFHRLRRSSSDTRLPRLDIDEDDAYTACGTDLLVSAGGDSSTEASPGAADSQESLYVSDQQEGREGDKDRESASSPSNYQYCRSTSSRPARHKYILQSRLHAPRATADCSCSAAAAYVAVCSVVCLS